MELTGITDELLREEGIGKQAFAELLAALLTPGTMLAAYNAQFDLLFLYSFLQKYGDARLLQDKPKLDPVSYTHLDVYKRQVLYRVLALI